MNIRIISKAAMVVFKRNAVWERRGFAVRDDLNNHNRGTIYIRSK